MTQVAPCRFILYQNSWPLWESNFSAVGKLHVIRIRATALATLSQHPPKENPPPRNLRRMRRGIFPALNRHQLTQPHSPPYQFSIVCRHQSTSTTPELIGTLQTLCDPGMTAQRTSISSRSPILSRRDYANQEVFPVGHLVIPSRRRSLVPNGGGSGDRTRLYFFVGSYSQPSLLYPRLGKANQG